MRASCLIATVTIAMLIAGAYAATPSASLQGFLSGYMSNGTISQFSFYNITLNGSSYVVGAAANQSTYLAIGKQGGKYSLMTNASQINPVMQAYFNQYENLSEVSYLNTAMKRFQSQAAPPISDCITETNANPPLTDNFTNAINACASIPHCGYGPIGLLGAFGAAPPYSVAGIGLQNFSVEVGTYNTSINSYFKLVQGINVSNAGTKLAAMGTDISNITAVEQEMTRNPLFPPPYNVTASECNGSGLPVNQPWFCVQIGYCESLSFNNTLLDSISSTQQQLESIIPSKAKIATYSSDSASTDAHYLEVANAKVNSGPYKAFLNSTYPTYNSTVAEISVFLTKSSNANLSTSLVQLKASFSAILANGVNVSIGTESGSFNSLLTTVIERYNAANQSFSEASSASSNYTLDAIAAQLNYRRPPVKLSDLAAQLQALDLEMGSGLNITATQAAIPELKTIGLQLHLFVPITTIGYLIKLADGWFINAALAGSSASVPSKIASAPTYAALLSFIIGLIILILIYLGTHRRLAQKHKLRRDRKSSMAWMIFFVVVFLLVLLYAYGTYVYAQAANNFIPFAYFTGYLHSSKAAFIVLNGSAAYSDPGITSCAGEIAAVLKSENKTVTTVQATNYSCVAGGTVSPLGVDCIDGALSSGKPVISLSQTGNGIVYKGLYGTIMYASGANATGTSCILAQLIAREK